MCVLLTRADVHDMVEGVHALNYVHHQIGEANVILHDQRIYRLRLDHVVHQVEPLGVLQAALCQTLVGTLVVYCTALGRKGRRGEVSVGDVERWDGSMKTLKRLSERMPNNGDVPARNQSLYFLNQYIVSGFT